MKHKIITILIAFLFPVLAHAQTSNYWYPNGNNLQPIINTYGLQIPKLGSTGNPCVDIVNTSGLLATTTCAGGSGSSTNYWTKSGNNLFNNTGSSTLIGVNTSAPPAYLSIQGPATTSSVLDIRFSGDPYSMLSVSSPTGNFGDGGCAEEAQYQMPDVNHILDTVSCERMTLESSDPLYIEGGTPSYSGASVNLGDCLGYGNSTCEYIDDEGQAFNFQFGGTTEDIIDTVGVGLGTASPSHQLEVSGDGAQFDSEVYDSTGSSGTNGQLLKSTGTSTLWVATSTLGFSGGGGTNYFTNSSASTSLTTGSNLLANLMTAGTFIATSSTFSGNVQIGSSTASTTFTVDVSGHMLTGGTQPTCTSGCGTAPNIWGDDNTFRVLLGSSITSATITFASTWVNSRGQNISPSCSPTDESGVTTGIEGSSTPTTVVLSLPTALTGKLVTVQCQASDNFTF